MSPAWRQATGLALDHFVLIQRIGADLRGMRLEHYIPGPEYNRLYNKCLSGDGLHYRLTYMVEDYLYVEPAE